MKLIVVIISLFSIQCLFAQNLFEERIWKVSSRKKSIFLDSGVFHYNSQTKNVLITGLRNSFAPDRGYERIVLDFNNNTVPKIYGHISSKDQKLSIDFFGTSISSKQTNLRNSKFVKSVDFISVDGQNITMEMALKSKVSFDVFYLENPGRLVIDIK